MPDATEEKPEVTDEEEKQIDNETLDRIMIKRDAKTRQMEARERYYYSSVDVFSL